MIGEAEEASMSSAAEFVEGGTQDPCDDACSICLESFCEDDPATVSDKPILGRLVCVGVDFLGFRVKRFF